VNFLYKSVCTVFLYLCFGFVIFWRKKIGAKGVRKMLMKLTLVYYYVSGIWTSLRAEPISGNEQCAPKMFAHIKNGQK